MRSIHHRSFGFFFLLGVLICTVVSCSKKATDNPLFTTLSSKQTGLSFTNKLTSTDSFNLFKYMYFYNGAGIGSGDFNNDGDIDLFFSSNQGQNTLYLNKGQLKFADVTREANVPNDGAWSTGVSVADVNADGLLDIYVCRVGNYRTLQSKNQLLVCTGVNKNGTPQYIDSAKEYGLDFSGFSTQSVFFDFDLDGDLDMFLLNHSVHENGTFRPRKEFEGTYNDLSGGRLYRNDGSLNNGPKRYTDITRTAGINSSAINYGLGVVVSDIDMDGYPDIYIGNDFHENDYLYINQQNGSFREELNDHVMHTSQFSMGVDAADINNDGHPEVISVDMLPDDPYVLKRSLGEDEYDVFNRKIGYGYNYQYTRNNLQFNRQNGMFSEVGLYSGIAATDWSWSPLWFDFDNDGLKDLFISNGIPKRMNDIDYINFISDNEIQQKIIDNKLFEKDAALMDKFPNIKLPNKFYRNKGNLQFEDIDEGVADNPASYSNGAVYADFDNDGDLDVVVNNIDEPALLYQNNSDRSKPNQYISLQLRGPANNVAAIGAKAIVFEKGNIRTYEKFPVHGFQSSMEASLHIGLSGDAVNSILLIWPDNTFQKISLGTTNAIIKVEFNAGLPQFNYSLLEESNRGLNTIEDITASSKLNFIHRENSFPEFNRESLLPHLLSTEGPALAIADINNDGLEDVFFGSARDQKSAVFLQGTNGQFSKLDMPALIADSIYEDVDAVWIDVDGNNTPDLIVASGGNEFFGQEEYLTPRVYLNDGQGHLTRKKDAFNQVFITASTIAPVDINKDGFMDLFIGGRTLPWDYGKVPRSYLLLNDKSGKFVDATERYSKELVHAGFVTKADWFDLDKDGDEDLLLAMEWSPPTVYINNNGQLTKKELSDKSGWWNFLLPTDVDGDGDIDLVAGNLGLNSRLKASDNEPVKLYYNDFDGNGKNEQVLTYFLKNKEIPFANKAELERQIPVLKKRFLFAKALAEASLEDIFTNEKLRSANVLQANYFSNAVFINDGQMNFSVKPLPWDAQFTSYRDALTIDANNDNLPDLLLVGNYYDNNIEMGRYDADFGSLLINKGNGAFKTQLVNGLMLKGQSRHINKIKLASGKLAYVVAKNNDSAMMFQFLPPVSAVIAKPVSTKAEK